MYICNKCSSVYKKWAGKCFRCNEWNTLEEENSQEKIKFEHSNLKVKKIQTFYKSFDLLCGDGVVSGSTILLSGSPGIGKSTFAMKVFANTKEKIAYISGEESISQVQMRKKRLEIDEKEIAVTHENDVEKITAIFKNFSVVIIDSIQTLKYSKAESYVGSIQQVRFCTEILLEEAKKRNVVLFIIGHVTKDGSIAGPKTLEHMVDVVINIKKDPSTDYYLIESNKNRFGSTNEIALFKMEKNGLNEIENHESFFLQERTKSQIGSCIFPNMEGTKCFLLEIQTLVHKSSLIAPRRSALGINYNRLNMILAVIETYCNIPFHKCDVFVNVTGGVQINDIQSDLAIALGLVSSFKQIPIPNSVAFGEISLSGEVKKSFNAKERFKISQKLGFKNFVFNLEKNPLKINQVQEITNIIQKLNSFKTD